MPSSTDFSKRALQLLGVIDPTETPSSEDGELAHEVLNQWMDELGTQRQSIYYITRTAHTLVSGTASYTIGSGGTINIARPLWIEDAGLIIDTGASTPVEAPIRVLDDDERAQIPQKTLQSNYVQGVWLDHNWSAGLASVFVYPIPNVSNTQLVLYTPTALIEFADQSTNYTFPPGYRTAILWNLANELAPFYPSVKPDPRIAQKAAEKIAWIKRGNLRLSEVYVDRAIVQRRGSGTVTASQFASGNFG